MVAGAALAALGKLRLERDERAGGDDQTIAGVTGVTRMNGDGDGDGDGDGGRTRTPSSRSSSVTAAVASSSSSSSTLFSPDELKRALLTSATRGVLWDVRRGGDTVTAAAAAAAANNNDNAWPSASTAVAGNALSQSLPGSPNLLLYYDGSGGDVSSSSSSFSTEGDAGNKAREARGLSSVADNAVATDEGGGGWWGESLSGGGMAAATILQGDGSGGGGGGGDGQDEGGPSLTPTGGSVWCPIWM